MPLVTIDVLKGRSAAQLDDIADAVHTAMIECLAVPPRDRFQLIHEHEPGRLRFDPDYLDIHRDERFVLVRLTLVRGRTAEVKQAFYRRLAELLGERAGVPAECVMVTLVENTLEDWSFGRGEANLLERPRETWR